MKRKLLSSLLVLTMSIGALALTGCGSGGSANSITVCNYGMYIDPAILDSFERDTGIHVKYEEAVTPEELYTKYKSGAIKYDLVCTSDYMIQRLINEGALKELNYDYIPNAQYLTEECMSFAKSFDPDGKYIIPYFWGTVGILYDTTKVNAPVDSWDVLFNGEYAGNIIMQNSMRDSYYVALKYLGYSLNTTDENEIMEAQQLLINQKTDVQAYLVDEVRDEIVAGNAAMGVIYSGEAYAGIEANPNLAYVVPKEGSNLWIDCWGMTTDCQKVENASKFLDYLLKADIGYQNFDYVRYSSPNILVLNQMSDEDRNNEALYPALDSLTQCEVAFALDSQTSDLLNKLWKELKAQ